MDDETNARFGQHEALMTRLVRLLDAQHDFNRQQVEINAQQVEINADTRTTLARIETLLARMLRHEDNGHDA